MRNENKGYFEIMSTLFIMVVTFIIFIVAGEINEQYRVPYTVSMLVLLFIGASFTFTDVFNRAKYKQVKRPDKEMYGVELSAWATSTMDTIIIISIYTLASGTINYNLVHIIIIGIIVLILFLIIFGLLEGRKLLRCYKRYKKRNILYSIVTLILVALVIFIINCSIPNGAPCPMMCAVAVITACRLIPEYILPPLRITKRTEKQAQKRTNNLTMFICLLFCLALIVLPFLSSYPLEVFQLFFPLYC